MLIDLHAHNLTEGMMDLHPFWGPRFEYEPGRPPRLTIGDWQLRLSSPARREAALRGEKLEPIWDTHHQLDNRLAAMDRAGIDRMAVCIPAHMYMYWTEPEFGRQFTRTANEELAAYAERSDRIYFWAALPMQDPEAAAAELRRAVTEDGALGASLGGANIGGREFDDEAFDVVWAAACDLDVPLFIHGYNQSVTWDGREAQAERYSITSIVGMCYDETSCFWNLVCGGVFDRFPDLKVYITHGGGFVPYQLGRMATTNAGLEDGRNKKPVMEYLSNFYFDPYVHSEAMRRAIVDVIGPDNLLYGDNFAGSDVIKFKLTDGLGLSESDVHKIHYGNAEKLLRL